MTTRTETGIETLRRIIRTADSTREDAISKYSPTEIINLFEAVWASDWDIFPDELTLTERDFAANYGKLPATAHARLNKLYGVTS